jgi:hypothetical protein
LTSQAVAPDRDAKVRDDRKAFSTSADWIYNDLASGIRAAKVSGKPLFVAIRCIPCEACQEFDDDVARRDPVIRDQLDHFVCVRIVQANTLELERFQYDFDQSFAIVFMNADGTIYGRYGTRSSRQESEDISLQGLAKAMEAILSVHKDGESRKASLAGKQPKPTAYKTPRDYPSLAGRYPEALDYQGQVARSCIHCHQIREAERRVFRDSARSVPDEVLFPYPDPRQIGLKMDPKETATVVQVTPGTPAARAGILPGDVLRTLSDQPLFSTADIQWVLHNTPTSAKLPVQVTRAGKTFNGTIQLDSGWRRGDISWRASTWDLRRMALGGMRLEPLTESERRDARVGRSELALKVKHLGEHGDHGVAFRAGVRQNDVITAFGPVNQRATESLLIANALQENRAGDEVSVTVLRNGERKMFKFARQ